MREKHEINFNLQYEEITKPRRNLKLVVTRGKSVLTRKTPISNRTRKVVNMTMGELRKQIEVKESNKAGITATKIEVRRIRRHAHRVTK